MKKYLIVLFGIWSLGGNACIASGTQDKLDQAGLDEQMWEYLARINDPIPTWQPNYDSESAYLQSVAPLRQQLLDRVGTLPPQSPPPQPVQSQSEMLVDTGRFTIEWVRFPSRLDGVSVFAYLARPVGLSGPRPAVLMLHGEGAAPHTAFGWRLPGDGVAVSYTDSPFAAAAVDFVDAGYVVLVPWLSDNEHSTWYGPEYNHWYELERWGALRRLKLGDRDGGGGYAAVLPQVLASIDFLERDPQVASNHVGLLGWNQGAEIAGVAAALDPRVAALARIAPPLDKRRMRSEPAGLKNEVPFIMLDSLFGNVEQAALLAPRPLLFSYSIKDPVYPRQKQYVSPDIYAQLEKIYIRLGRTDFVRSIESTDQRGAASLVPLDWLNRVFGYVARPRSDDAASPLPPDGWVYPADDHEILRDEMADHLALPPTPQISVDPNFDSLGEFASSVAPLRERVIKELVGDMPPERPIVCHPRRLIVDYPGYYKLEWVQCSARFSDPYMEIGGYLATPYVRRSDGATLLSLDGNYHLDPLFGLEIGDPNPYDPYDYFATYNSYGDRLARSGYVIFAPYFKSYGGEYWGGVLGAKTGYGRGRALWPFALPLYLSSVDFLLSLPGTNRERLGVIGISYAGVAALYTAAVDQRLTALVYSNPASSWETSYQDPETVQNSPVFDIAVASSGDSAFRYLIAPRRFIFESESGEGWDPPYPDPDEEHFQPIYRIQQAYRRLDREAQFQWVPHDRGHVTRPWLFDIF